LPLGEFLTNPPTTIDFSQASLKEHFVTLYPISWEEGAQSSPQSPPQSPQSSSSPTFLVPQRSASDPDVDPEFADQKHRGPRKSIPFHDPHEFFRYGLGCPRSQSSIVFLRGYMSATWINNVGSRYMIDPEFFCRHLDFRPADDNSNNFSVPALPSSSWHLIELPVITLGTRRASKGATQLDKIEELRIESNVALSNHHHQISKLASSGMVTGKSMVRRVYVFDETHFAIEQQISIAMQVARDGSTFICKSHTLSAIISIVTVNVSGVKN
jgi:hypothetical protein